MSEQRFFRLSVTDVTLDFLHIFFRSQGDSARARRPWSGFHGEMIKSSSRWSQRVTKKFKIRSSSAKKKNRFCKFCNFTISNHLFGFIRFICPFFFSFFFSKEKRLNMRQDKSASRGDDGFASVLDCEALFPALPLTFSMQVLRFLTFTPAASLLPLSAADGYGVEHSL